MVDDEETDTGGLFDKLTGQDELKERVAELQDRVASLEDENAALEKQLEAERERRKEEVREKQNIAEERNKLQDKVAGLEGSVSETGTEDGSDVVEITLSYRAVPEFLERIESFDMPDEAACTAVVENVADIPDEIQSVLSDAAVEAVRRRAPCILFADDYGVCRVALQPPQLPDESEVIWDDTFAVDRELFVPTGPFTFAVLRSDTFAMAEYDGEERGEVTTISSDVKSAHSKGGFSQGRFERRRDAQIAEHVENAEDALAGAVTPRIVVGEEAVVNELDVDVSLTGTTDVTEASEEALDRAFWEYWETRVTLL